MLKALSQRAALMTYWGCGHPLVLPCVVHALRAHPLQHRSAALWREGPDRPLTRRSQEQRERRSPSGAVVGAAARVGFPGRGTWLNRMVERGTGPPAEPWALTGAAAGCLKTECEYGFAAAAPASRCPIIRRC